MVKITLLNAKILQKNAFWNKVAFFLQPLAT
jgi:hypothetical protein